MSAFEVVVTPTRVKNDRRKTAAREPTSVVLAPFAAKSVVTFDDIPVTKTARRFLSIVNPSDHDLTLSLKHSIDPEFGVTFEWSSTIIPSNKTVSMAVVWTPKVEVKTKDIIRLIDDRHFVKDVSLIFKSIDTTNFSQKSTKSSATTKPRNISGKLKIKSPSPPQTLLKHTIMPTRQRFKSMPSNSTAVSGSKSNTSAVACPKTPLKEYNFFNQDTKFNCIVGKENLSPPRTPIAVTALFDQIQFTPVSFPKSKTTSGGSIDLASLPTPVLKPINDYLYAQVNPPNTIYQSGEITSFEPNIASTVSKEMAPLTPLHFTDADPRRILFNTTSSMTVLCPENEQQVVSSAPVLNVTHTIIASSNLSTIMEDRGGVVHSLQNTFKISPISTPAHLTTSNHQFVGSSLQKKFQSMRNLDKFTVETKILKENQGSMPNLTEIEAIRPIENNRYYFQSVEKDLQMNDNRNQLNVSSVCGSIMSFKEHDILAQSSQFNLNESSVNYTPIINSNCREFAIPKPVDNYHGKRQIDEDASRKSRKWSPPKRCKLENISCSSISTCSSSKSDRRSSNWSGVKPKKFLYNIPKLNLTRHNEDEERIVFFDPEHHIKAVINPDVFAATTTIDPFLSATMYLDEECIEKHEINFKKWLNALVTIPWEVDIEQQQPIDFGKLFNEVRDKDLNMAETKEVVSSHYLTKHRMEGLRKTATTLYTNDKMTAMFQKLCVQIERGQLRIRDGTDLHLDIVLQRDILQLLLYFNPLWLRISLEVIYGEIINMNHNFDILSLSRFIVNRLFKNKHLEQKYSKIGTQKSDQLKKFTLKKLFMLLVFLDHAKQNKIITYNPCLFIKTSPYKETKEILFRFSSLILGGVGDIQRDLKRIGIVLTHKQTYIEEFDYAFRNLAVDLRDGIRLTKVMEIILLRDDMVNQLRVPAISRLQKVYNVDLALKALKNADYVIAGGINAADIADGHREKTLSLLWQIIYKFRSPKFVEAATTIQFWWRRSWFKVSINQRIRAKIQKRRAAAAICIQALYRGYLSRISTKVWHAKRTSAAVILQSHIRRYLAQRHYKNILRGIITIQHWYKNICLLNRLRNQFLVQRNAVHKIQRWYRRICLARKIEKIVLLLVSIRDEFVLQNRYASVLQQRYRAKCLMRMERNKFLQIRSATIVIQQHFRSFQLMKRDRSAYLCIRDAIIAIQRRHRANVEAKSLSEESRLKNRAAICIQTYFRATVEAKRVRNEFLKLKNSATVLQARYRARVEMVKAMQEYDRKKRSVIAIQQRYRAHVEMIKNYNSFKSMKSAAIILQTRYRSIREMRQQRQSFLRITSAAQVLQTIWKATLLMRKQRNDYIRTREATITVQRRVIANRQMLEQRRAFVKLKNATICIQTNYRAQLCMREERSRYLQLRWACTFVQERFRSNNIAKIQLETYQRLRYYTICIQRRFLANKLMKYERNSYSNLKVRTIIVQRIFRATLAMRLEQKNYLSMKKSCIFVQRKYRAKKAMEIDYERFKMLKKSVSVIQTRYRAQILMKNKRNEFLKQKSNAIKIQRWVRSIKLARDERHKYLMHRQNVCNVQNRYRGKLLMHQIQSDYQSLQWAVLVTQQKYRAKRAMIQQRNEFHLLRHSVIAMQRRFRAKVTMSQQMLKYHMITKSVKTIQTYFRSYKLMNIQRISFLTIRNATITIQQRFRSYKVTKIIRQEFLTLRRSTIFLQRRHMANLLMRKERTYYVKVRYAAIVTQRRYRAQHEMIIQRNIYQRQKKAALVIQLYFRATLQMRFERRKYLALRNATLFCQRKFRANCMMFEQRCLFLIYRRNVSFIQSKYRAILEMRKERSTFELLKKSAIFTQRRFRANTLAKGQRFEYLKLKQIAVYIQLRFRANKAMEKQRNAYLLQKKSCLVLQRRFRAIKIAQKQRVEYLQIHAAIVTIQRRYAALKLMQHERMRYQQIRKAVIIIQSKYREYLISKEVRSKYSKLRQATIQIQTRFRATILMRRERTDYLTIQRSTIVIQRWFRATILMRTIINQYKLIKCLVVHIQRRFRAKLAMKIDREKFLRIRSAVVVLQQRYRGQKLMVMERNNFEKTKSTILGVQSRIRGWLARREYQQKLTPEVKLLIKQTKCAKKIQASWRGWVERNKKGAKAVALKRIRGNIQRITTNVKPEKQLKNVLFSYVTVLKTKYNANEILNVLYTLTRLSRVVPHIFIKDSIFVANFCYGIMSQAIRSELDKLIIEQCSYIILNLARYQLTQNNSFQLQGLTTIAQMLLRWCDKDCDIFNTLCSVIYVFGQGLEMNTQIRKFMVTPNAVFTLNEIKRLVIRKENMRKNKSLHSVQSPLTSQQKTQLPMLKPDFGMNSNAPYIFNCSVFAFDTILKQLNIHNL